MIAPIFRSFFVICLCFLASCQKSADVLTPKSKPTEQELARVIRTLPEYASFQLAQSQLDGKSAVLKSLLKADLIQEYYKIRQNFDSSLDFAKSSKAEDQALIMAVMEPLKELRQKRDQQISFLTRTLQNRYEISEVDVRHVLYNPGGPNARLLGGCEDQARLAADATFMYCVNAGYGYSFASGAADYAYQAALGNCMGGDYNERLA
jgi:cell fate (sporulation/competence/biofilm development) regulator YlbF (YheA/YmcA/DUF963 family)